MAEIGTVEFAREEFFHMMQGKVARAARTGGRIAPEERDEALALAAEWNGVSADALKAHVGETGGAA